MKENKVLVGRTLTDLIDEHRVDDVLEGEVIVDVNLNEIKPNPYQPRRIFNQEKIDELAQSIKEHGVFQPIIIKKVKEGYLIVSGERRFRAAKQVGLSKIPAIIRPYEDEKVAEIALVENLQREDLTPLEEAEAYSNVMRHLKLTQSELADKIGKSRSHVTNMLGLLTLPQEVQEFLLTHKLSMGHARALSKLSDKNKIIKLANKIINEGLSVRTVEDLTQNEEKNKQIIRQAVKSPYEEVTQNLTKKYGFKFKVNNNRIILDIKDEEVVQKVLDYLSKM